MNTPYDFRIGIDLGGTKTEIIAIDRDGTPLHRHRIATPSKSYKAIIRSIAELVEHVEHRMGGHGSVGVATPGSLSPRTGLIRNANTTALNGHPLDRDLSASLRRPVRVNNDANCFALSESVDGSGRGHNIVFGVILGTGAGAGIVIGNRPLIGCNGVAGEWGHNPLPWPQPCELPGPECYCGKAGCIETFLSGPGMTHDHETRSRQTMTPPQIVAAARGGDETATSTLSRYCDRVARCLTTVVNLLDPDVIVVGGGMSNLIELYEEIPERIKLSVFSDTYSTLITPALHGDSSGVRGAAWLWPAA